MVKISAVIITFNEEKNIERCIRSVQRVADEVLVVDSYSTDGTESICRNLGVRFILHEFEGYRDQKNYAVSQATYDYILSLDADEALSVELEQEILKVKENWKYDGYKFNRLNHFNGRWVYHTIWYPDRKLRLFDRRKGSWTGRNVHELVTMEKGSKEKILKGHLLHWPYRDMDDVINSMNRYSRLSAIEMYKKGVKVSFLGILLHTFWAFIKSYFLKAGFLDGVNGYVISRTSANNCFYKYAILYYLHKNSIPIKKIDHEKLPSGYINIGFDAKRVFNNFSGLGNYSRFIIKSLKPNKDISITLYTPKISKKFDFSQFSFRLVLPSKFLYKLFNSIWRSKWIINDLKKQGIHIFHGLSNEIPFGIHKTKIKSVVTIHDLIFIKFPEFYNPIDVFIYRIKANYACKYSDRIIAVSSQTKTDIIEYFKGDPKKICVIHQGCSELFYKKYTSEDFLLVRNIHLLPEKYLLYVGTIEKRKNLLTLLKAIKENFISVPLVVVGKKTSYFYDEILPYINKNNLHQVVVTSNVKSEHLPIIYQNALCFIYPSIYEGFGIPIIEALVSGVPVITSNIECLKDAGGEGAIYVNPNDSKEIASAINIILNDNNRRFELIKKGGEHVLKFSPENISKQLINIYKELYFEIS